ncbi:MAG TPA: porin [bacterium]|jgi:phosphate-selective porin OprO/OprP|nr:porin [bacterium]
MKKLKLTWLLAAAVLSFAGNSVWADEDSGDLKTQLKEITQRLQTLESEKTTGDTGSAGSVVITPEHNYLDFSSADGNTVFKLGGVVQSDYRYFLGPNTQYFDPTGRDTFLIRKVRLDLVGYFDKFVGFRFQEELGATGVAVQDAYAFIKADPALQFQFGKSKEAIGLERLQNDTDTLFAERGLPTDLVPNRDLGFQINGKAEDFLSYQAEISNGTPDNQTPANTLDTDSTNGKDLTGRLFLTPFHSEDSFLKGLGVGVAGSWAWQQGALPANFTTSTGQETFFSYKTTATPAGDFYHFSPQGYFYAGPFGLLAEFVQTTSGVGLGVNSLNLTNQAWQVNASWVIGGKASYLGAVADTPLDLSKGHWGALELAFRVNQVLIDPNTFGPTAATNYANPGSAQQATAYGFGANWIFNEHFKLVFDFEDTDFQGGNAPAGGWTSEDVFVTRAQANF